MFKKAFFVVAAFSFIFSFVALIVGVDPSKYNFISILDRITRIEFPDVLNIFNDTFKYTLKHMNSWESFLPSWLSWLDNVASPVIWCFNFGVVLWDNAISLIVFIINFFISILPVNY